MAAQRKYLPLLTLFIAPWLGNACSSEAANSPASASNSGEGGHSQGPGGTGAVLVGGIIAAGGMASGGQASAGWASGDAGSTAASGFPGGGATMAGGAVAYGGSNGATTGASGGAPSNGGNTGMPVSGGRTTSATGGATESTGPTSASGGATSPSGGMARGGFVAGGGSTAAGGTVAAGGRAAGGAGAGGATGAAGATAAGGTGRAGGSPGLDAGANPDGASGTGGSDCTFAGGNVTAALFPNGLTLRKVCSSYQVSGININDNGVLTIEPGVTLRFASRAAIDVGLQGSGKLVAVGTAADPIIFTSQEGQPSPGFWRGLVFDSGTLSGSKVAYAQVSAAGANRDGCIVGAASLPAGAVVLDHITVDKVGDGSDGVLALGNKSDIAITNSSFVDIGSGSYPISVLADSFAGIGTGNTYPVGSVIEVAGGTVDTTVAWSNPGIPVVVTGDVMVEGTGSPVLTIGAGMTLEFAAGVALQVGKAASGKIIAAGTTSSHVTWTALGNAPQAGDWAGVEIWENGKAALSYAELHYGGSNTGDSKGNLTLESSASTVQLAVDHCNFTDGKGWGIYVPCASTTQTAIITVDTYTTYSNNALGTKGPGLVGPNCP